MATVMAAVALCVTATRGTSVGAADVPVVPAKGDLTIRLNWWGGDARIKAMIAELQESIDFNSDLSWLDRNYGRDTPAIHWFAISHTSPTNSPLGCSLNGSASERGAKDHTAYASYTLAPSS